MHSDDDEDRHISRYYGIWPGVVGLLIAVLLTWFMFAFADGFS